MVERQNSWKTISLKWWGIIFYNNQKSFPKTTQIINSVNGLVSASFNFLEAGSKIKPHCGDTNGIYRVHLGIEIPDIIPTCGFRVKDEWKSWEEGKILVFVDAVNHEAINLSSRDRFILSFDVIRPEYIDKKKYIEDVPNQPAIGGLKEHVQNFLRGVRKGEKQNASVETGAKTAIISEMGNIAYRSGKLLHWDSSTMKFAEEEGNKLSRLTYREPWKLPVF